MFPRFFFALFLIGLVFDGAVAGARIWTDASGEFKIDAELLRLSDDGASVTLRRSDGEEITLKIDSLCEADRKFIQEKPKANETRGPEKNPFLTPKERGVVAPTGKVNHRRALLIGVNEYKHFRKLEFCGTDVQALGQRLTAAGFDRDKVVVVHDAATRSLQPDKEKIVNQITLLLDSAAVNDLIFLSFSGHGVRIGGKSYLVPYEGEMPESAKDEERLKTLISLDWLYEKLQACPAATKIFLVDACQNRLFSGDQRSARASVTPESIGQSLQSAPKSVLLMTACAPGEVSHESSDLKHGVYTHFLLEALEGRADYNHDGVVSVKEANLYASEKTEHFVRTKFSETQRPSFKGEMQGDVPLAECLQMDRITVPDDVEKLEIAFQRIAEGGTITVKPGIYRYSQSLEITREMTVVGSTGDPKDVIFERTGGNAVKLSAKRARIQSVSLRNVGTLAPAIFVPTGRLELAKCDVTSEKGNGILAAGSGAEVRASHTAIHDAGMFGVAVNTQGGASFEQCSIFGNAFSGVAVSGANPTFRDCSFRDGKQCGVLVEEGGQGTFQDCDLFGNVFSNVLVRNGGNPTFRNCKIHDGKAGGVLVISNGQGTFDNCSLFSNTICAIDVQDGGKPTVKGCKIYDGKTGGILVSKKGAGVYEDCDVYGNTLANMFVESGGDPVVKRCKFHDGKQSGAYVYDEGLGTFEDCDFSKNHLAGINVRGKSNPTVKNCRMFAGEDGGVVVGKDGRGTFNHCDLYNNRLSNFMVSDGGDPMVTNCTMRDGREAGVRVGDNGLGTFEDCDMSGNGLAGFVVRDGANPTVRRCKMHDGKEGGVLACNGGFGTFEECEMYRNNFAGVVVREQSNPTVRNCKMYDGREGGVYIYDGGHGVFENNSLYRNGNGAWVINNSAGSFRRSGNSPNR